MFFLRQGNYGMNPNAFVDYNNEDRLYVYKNNHNFIAIEIKMACSPSYKRR